MPDTAQLDIPLAAADAASAQHQAAPPDQATTATPADAAPGISQSPPADAHPSMSQTAPLHAAPGGASIASADAATEPVNAAASDHADHPPSPSCGHAASLCCSDAEAAISLQPLLQSAAASARTKSASAALAATHISEGPLLGVSTAVAAQAKHLPDSTVHAAEQGDIRHSSIVGC